MILYQYRCEDGHLTDEYFSMASYPLAITCLACQKEAILVITGGSGFILDGADWPGKTIKGDTHD